LCIITEVEDMMVSECCLTRSPCSIVKCTWSISKSQHIILKLMGLKQTFTEK